MSHTRNHTRKAVRRLKGEKPVILDQTEHDKVVIDHVLKVLYNNSSNISLSLENQVYTTFGKPITRNEAERLWEIMLSSGLVSPVIGFGNAGKVALTRTGYQLMSQFGGYKEYLTAMQNSQGPQTIILPIQVEGGADEAVHDINPGQEEKQQPSIKKVGKRRSR
jgi:hypothetical protein